MKDDENIKNYGSKDIPDEIINFKKICNSRCNICRSGILKEIHEWHKDGAHLQTIVDKAAAMNVQISTASLSRHFRSYTAYKTEMAVQIIKDETLEEITTQSVHLKKTVELLDLAYDILLTKFRANTYRLDVSDLEKLAKIRYQVLNGENLDNNDIMAIFQKATDKYGVNLQQGVLFKT